MKIETRPQRFRAVSLVVLLCAVASAVYSFTLPMGTISNPGAGVWPAGLSVAQAVGALLLLVTERDSSDYESFTRRTVVVFAGFGLMAVFVMVFSLLGLTIAALVLSLVWLRWLAKESWRLSVVLAIVFTSASVLVFEVLLRIPMPHDVVVGSLIEGLR